MTPSEIEAFCARHARMVAAIASAKAKSVPSQITYADLMAAGNLGLVKAAHKYDPSLGVPEKNYARRRITGEILDMLRGEDPLSRDLRRECKLVERGETLTSQKRQARAMVMLTRTEACNYDLAWLKADGFGAPSSILRSLDYKRMRRMIQSLGPRARRLFELKLADETEDVIAQRLGLSPGRINQIYWRAVRLMRFWMLRPQRSAA